MDELRVDLRDGKTILDVAVGKLAYVETPRERRRIKAVVDSIEKIRVDCAGQNRFIDIMAAKDAEYILQSY